MRPLLPALLLLLLPACGSEHTAPPAKPHHAVAGDLAIVGATVIPMDREGTLAAQTVLVRAGAIALVAPEADVDTDGATVVDGHGKWLLPGLADMHVHFWNADDLDLFVLEGVTTVRNMFGSTQHLAWRDAIARGERVGPTLITAGPILDGDPPVWPGSDVVTTRDAARAAVDAQKKAGYDWIKVYNGLSPDVYDAILAEAKAVGLPVGGHVPTTVGIAKVIASGQRSIEHLDGYVPFRGEPVVDAAIVDATVQAGVWNCPTLVVTDRFGHMDDLPSLAQTRGLDLVSPAVRAQWDPKTDFRLQHATPATFEQMRARNVQRRTLVGDLQRAGAHLVLGTDTGNPYVVPGFAVGDELAMLVASGLTPWQALHAATAAAADLQGTPGRFGVIATGARADLLLVDRDPLADVTAVFDPPLVILRGVVHHHDELLATAKARLAPHAGDRFASMPALEAEGTATATARYQVILQNNVLGEERAVISDGGRVVRGQAVLEAPAPSTLTYRATADRLEESGDGLTGGLVVTRTASAVHAVLGGNPPVERPAGHDTVIAPQSIAEYVWYAQRIADLAIGGKRTIDAVEVMTDSGITLAPAHYVIVRKPDADGRRVYTIAGKDSVFDLSGTFSVDPDGAPHDVSLTLPFGVFEMKRE